MQEMESGERILRPSAARLLESMRDIGYSFESALADIVDNSISAGAGLIEIINDVDQDQVPYLAVLDDGCGMSSEELTQAMQHGSRSPRDERAPGDLGRFGLGLKTASFSQCRRLTVVSRKNGRTAARCWDLDLVVARDEWVLKLLDDDSISRLPLVDRIGPQGTLVLWQSLDRLDALGSHPDQALAALNSMFSTARRHLALTFHRFIAPEPGDGTRKIGMKINGADVAALDPFARLSDPRSDQHEVENVQMDQGRIQVQAFTLPHHQRLTAAQLKELELGSSLVETQGLYVYRAKRLISGGTWLGLARKAELTKLLRVRVDVPTSLDTEWSVDVRKSRVQPPALVRAKLRPLVERMTDSARRPYTYRGVRQASGPGLPLWERGVLRGDVRYQINRTHPLIVRLQQEGEGSSLIEPLLLAIEASLPLDMLFSDYGSNPHQLVQREMDSPSLQQLMAAMVEALAPDSDSIPKRVAESVLATEMFAGKPEAREILQSLRRIEDTLG